MLLLLVVCWNCVINWARNIAYFFRDRSIEYVVTGWWILIELDDIISNDDPLGTFTFKPLSSILILCKWTLVLEIVLWSGRFLLFVLFSETVVVIIIFIQVHCLTIDNIVRYVMLTDRSTMNDSLICETN